MAKSKKQPPQFDPPEDPRLVGYARVSTGEQRLDLQLDALRRAGVMEDNLHVDDDASGMKKRRPGLDRALMDARRGDVFVVWRLDRLGRDVKNLIDLVQRFEADGIVFKSLTESIDTTTAAGRMFFTITAAFARYERDSISERTKAGMRSSQEAGVRMGAPRRITPEMVAEAKRMIAGGLSVASAAQRIATKHKIKLSANGLRHWLPGGVRAVLRSAKRKR